MKLKRAILLTDRPCCALCDAKGFLLVEQQSNRTISAFMQVLVGMCRSSQRSHALIVRFKIWKIPSPRSCRVWKWDSAVGLALRKDCLRRRWCLWSLSKTFLISSAGRIRKLNGYMDRKDQAAFLSCCLWNRVSIRGKPMPYLRKATDFDVCQ